MKSEGLVKFILNQKKYRLILLLLWGALIIAIFVKIFLWQSLQIYFLIFFSITIPVVIVIINLLPYSFHSNWLRLTTKFKGEHQLKTNVRVHIKNFNPWTDLYKKQNRLHFNKPFYDFNVADILESKDLIIVYGKNDQPFSYYGNTKPFGICLGNKKINDPDLYVVNFVSVSEAKEYNEVVFKDYNYINSGEITLRIYKRTDNLLRTR